MAGRQTYKYSQQYSDMKEKIIIIGAGGHAKVLIDIIIANKKYDIAGYIDFEDKGEIFGVKYLGNDDCLSEVFNEGVNKAVLGIGQVGVTKKRVEVVHKLKNIGFSFPSIIAQSAVVNRDVLIGQGVQMLDGTVINCCSTLGDFSIINTNATVEHDCKLGKFCHIATGAVLGGGVEIGDFSMIGSNAVVVQHINIGTECMVGSGGVVIKDISEKGTYVGNPVRKIL
jgi:sugar O-acyltransferase (sialic acid O-acetyltransferase NeuD family)